MAFFREYRLKYRDSDNKFICYKGDDSGLTEYQAKYNDTNNQFEIEYDNRRSPIINKKVGKYFAALLSRSLMKYNSAGTLQWDLPARESNGGQDVVVDSNDDVIIVGARESYSPLYTDMGLRKFDGTGSFIFGYNTGLLLEAVTVDSNDNIIFGGFRSGNNSIWKINSSGVLQWDYDSGATIYSIDIDSNDNIIAVGSRVGNKNVWKLNSAGALQWDYDTGASIAKDVAVDTNDDIVITHSNTAAPIKKMTKINAAGVFQWDYTSGAALNGVDTDSNDNVIIVGERDVGKTVWKLNSAGALQWDYDTGVGGEPFGVVVDGADNVYISSENNTLIKLNSAGAFQWSSSFFSVVEGTCLPRRLALDSSVNIYAATNLQYAV